MAAAFYRRYLPAQNGGEDAQIVHTYIFRHASTYWCATPALSGNASLLSAKGSLSQVRHEFPFVLVYLKVMLRTFSKWQGTVDEMLANEKAKPFHVNVKVHVSRVPSQFPG